MLIKTNRKAQVLDDLHDSGILHESCDNGILLHIGVTAQVIATFLSDYMDTVDIDYNFRTSEIKINFTSGAS